MLECVVSPVAMFSLDDATYLSPFANSFISPSHSHISNTRGIICGEELSIVLFRTSPQGTRPAR